MKVTNPQERREAIKWIRELAEKGRNEPLTKDEKEKFHKLSDEIEKFELNLMNLD